MMNFLKVITPCNWHPDQKKKKKKLNITPELPLHLIFHSWSLSLKGNSIKGNF